MGQWLLHDELFYRHNYDAPAPQFSSNAHRAAFLLIPPTELPPEDRVENDVRLRIAQRELRRWSSRPVYGQLRCLAPRSGSVASMGTVPSAARKYGRAFHDGITFGHMQVTQFTSTVRHTRRFEEAAARAEECFTLAAKAQERRQELETLKKEREAASQRRSDEEQLLEHSTAKVKKRSEEPQAIETAAGALSA